MKKLSDYNFGPSWHEREAKLKPTTRYLVLLDQGDLKKGQVVTFIGFDDVDNHYGIFVFVDADQRILEVAGDCAGPDHSCMRNIKNGLTPA